MCWSRLISPSASFIQPTDERCKSECRGDRSLAAVAILGFAVPACAADEYVIPPEKKNHWAWKAPVRPQLPEVKVGTWGGFVFINFDDNALFHNPDIVAMREVPSVRASAMVGQSFTPCRWLRSRQRSPSGDCSAKRETSSSGDS